MSIDTSNRVACETLDAMCSVCKVHCATWRSEDHQGDGHWTLDACDDLGGRWIVHHDDLLEAVVRWARCWAWIGKMGNATPQGWVSGGRVTLVLGKFGDGAGRRSNGEGRISQRICRILLGAAWFTTYF